MILLYCLFDRNAILFIIFKYIKYQVECKSRLLVYKMQRKSPEPSLGKRTQYFPPFRRELESPKFS